MQNFLGFLLRFLPKKILSHWVGKLVHLRLPGILGRWSVRAFAWKYNIALAEAERPVHEYKSIGELFTRKLKSDLRPIAGDGFAIHPCDSRLTASGEIEAGTLIQAKGRRYHVRDFLRDEALAGQLMDGSFYTYYLCPTDYHRVHSPVEGSIKQVIHVPGALWPVNEWSVHAIDELFAVNERVVVEIETKKGVVAVVFVGATNVGEISLSFDPSIRTNQFDGSEPKVRKYSEPPYVYKGSELGTFHMGSTVIVLYPKEHKGRIPAMPQQDVKVGEFFFS